MKKRFTLFPKSSLLLSLLIIFCGHISFSQVPQYFKGTGTSTNTIPMSNPGSHCQQLYLPGDFNTLPISGLITKIYFRNTTASASSTYTNFSVAFTQNALTAFPTTTFLTGLTPALVAPSITITGNATAGGWYEIPLTTPFLYDNTQTLIVEIKYDSRSPLSVMSGYTTTAAVNKRLSIITAPGPLTGNLSTLWGDWGMDVIPPTPCTTPPTPGTATTSATGICTGTPVNLNLTGNSSGTGQTYQWESAPTIGGTYTPVGSSQTTPSITINPSVTRWYRCAVTCSGNTQTSVPVEVVVNPAFPAGTYTINSALPTGGGNYQTFADAVTALNCGIAGPVIFNVNASSGPYNEQVIIPAIGGSSATNTITFNGNGRTVTDNGNAVTGQRAVFKLDGADYVTINNFVINTGAGTYGYGVQLLNDADKNTISNCIINTNTSSTSTTNYAGVLINSTASAITTAGASLCDSNTVTGNTITGGLAGVAIVANTTTSQVFGNKVLNNTITEFYNYGVYVNGNVGTLIQGNDISRPTRNAITIFYGVFYTTISLNTIVNANKFHDPFGGNLTTAVAAYAVDHVNCDATVGNENIVSNNLVYNFTGGTSTQNGFLCNGSDYVTYYHNTVALEDATATCTTCGTRGFYQQGTATGLTYKNNIVTIKRGGSGDKQGIYFEQATLTGVTLSNNDYYFYPGLSGLQEIGHLGATGYTTIGAWQAGSGQEAGSVSADPFYQSPGTGDYHPTAGSINNLGTPVGILTDITGAARSATTPDIGAYEFTVAPGINMGAEALVTPAIAANGCYTSAETVTIRIRNSDINPINFATNPVTVTTNVTGAVTQTLTAVINTGTLGASLTLDVPMSTTLNMGPTGVYTFNAFTTVAGDVNPGNDAMAPATRTKVVLAPGTVSANPTQYCITGGTPTLSTTGATGYGGLQWQQSITPGSGFADIPGATTSPYTVSSPITQTMYYRLITNCNGNTLTSNETSVTLNNPQITGTTPGASCGPGPVSVTLGATGSAGTTLSWYAAPTGGSPIGTGTTFNTPPISSNTPYYVSASIGASAENMPSPTIGTSTFFTASTGWGLRFTVNNAVTINSVKIMASNATAGAASMQIRITDLADVNVYTGPVHNFTIGTVLAEEVIPVNILVAPGNYKMVMTSTGINTLVRESSGVTFPYTAVSNAVSITAGANGTGTAQTTAAYYWFYNWVVSTGCESSRTTVLATVTTPPAATISYAGSPYCSNAGTATVTQTGTTGGTYSSTAGLTINASTGAVTLGTSTAGTYTVTYTIPAAGGCPVFTTTASITITAAPAATISYAGSPYCSNAGTATVTQTGTAGGTYSSTAGLTINASTGTVTLGTSTPGTYTVTYTVAASGGCALFTTTASITVNNCGLSNDNCATATNLVSGTTCVPTAGTNVGATQSIAPITCATFTSSSALDVWYSFTAVATAHTVTVVGGATLDAIIDVRSGACNGTNIGCADATVSGGTEVVALGGLTIGNVYYVRVYGWNGGTGTFTICVTHVSSGPPNDNCATATNLVSGTTCVPTAGTNVGATQSIAPITCGIFTSSSALDVWYSFTAVATAHTVTVVGGATLDAIIDVRSGACNGTNIGCADATVTGGTEVVALGGLTIGNVYYVRVYGWAGGTGTFTICVTHTASTPCNCTITGSTAVCSGSTGISYSGPAGMATYAWSITGNGTITSATNIQTIAVTAGAAGSYTLSLTTSNAGCSSSTCTLPVTVTAAPSATISYAGSPYCSTDLTAPVTRTGTAGGTYSSTAGLTINATTGTVTPNTSTPGTYTVTYTIAAGGGCGAFTTTTTITITQAPNAIIFYLNNPYCSNSGTATVSRFGTAGGTYSAAPAGLTINATTGAVTLGTSTPGTYTVTYTMAASGGCGITITTTTITITPAPSATISYTGSPYCSNAGTATVTRTGTAGGTYSSTAGLTLNATTGAVTLATSTPGTYVVTYTVAASGGCAVFTTTTSITITALPAATISYAGSPYCSNAGTATVTRTGTAGGTYSSTAGLVINASTGDVNLATSTAGTYTVTYTIAAGGGCPVVTTTTTITITTLPAATITYTGNPFCQNAGTATVTRTGTAGGTYSAAPAGLTINASTGTVTLGTSTPGTYTVTYTIAAGGGCAVVTATTSITVSSLSVAATAATASSTSLCGPTAITLSVTGGSLGTGATWRWYSGSCGGTLVGTGATLNITPTATTTYFVRAEGTCNTTTCVSVTVTVNIQPTIALTATLPTSLMPGQTSTLTATVTPANATNTTTWYRDGNVVPGATGLSLVVGVDALGLYTVRTTTTAGCTALSNSVLIKDSASGKMWLYPNPNSGQFQVRYYSNAQQLGFVRHIIMYNQAGQKVFDQTYPITGPYSNMNVDARILPSGVYVLQLTDAFRNEILATDRVVITR